MSCFVRISPKKWQLNRRLPKALKKLLLRKTTFERIVDRVAKEAKLMSCERERFGNTGYYRPVITLQVDPSTVALFHNAPSGYRAQYYRSARLGESANGYAVRKLLPRIRELLTGQGDQALTWQWVKKSLLDLHAKLWIKEGLWWRYAKRGDRHLWVARWVTQQRSPDSKKREKARWAALTPCDETRIIVKGVYLSLDGRRRFLHKRNRAEEIHELGYT